MKSALVVLIGVDSWPVSCCSYWYGQLTNLLLFLLVRPADQSPAVPVGTANWLVSCCSFWYIQLTSPLPFLLVQPANQSPAVPVGTASWLVSCCSFWVYPADQSLAVPISAAGWPVPCRSFWCSRLTSPLQLPLVQSVNQSLAVSIGADSWPTSRLLFLLMQPADRPVPCYSNCAACQSLPCCSYWFSQLIGLLLFSLLTSPMLFLLGKPAGQSPHVLMV